MGSLTLTELFKGRYTFKASRKYGGYFRKDSDHRDFVSIGTAAGVRASWLHSFMTVWVHVVLGNNSQVLPICSH